MTDRLRVSREFALYPNPIASKYDSRPFAVYIALSQFYVTELSLHVHFPEGCKYKTASPAKGGVNGWSASATVIAPVPATLLVAGLNHSYW
jgi:hypothetical protein